MKELSIVVPVYNTEKYLKTCITSLLNQNIDNYEIIIVNDESPDGSQKIIEEFIHKYPDLIKGFTKKNGGLGDTRNFGISHASGKYVMFVDSDDYIKENSLFTIVEKMNKENLDILVFDFVNVYESKKYIHEHAMNDVDVKDYILSTPNACNKAFRIEFLRNNNFKFPTKIWYEDLAVIPGLAKYTKKIGYLNEGIYFYINRCNSIMNQTSYNEKFLDVIKSIESLKKFLQKDYFQEIEYISIQHLVYGSSLKLLPFKKWDEMDLCINEHITYFSSNWINNIYYKKKPSMYRIYCQFLFKRHYRICSLLLFLKRKIIT